MPISRLEELFPAALEQRLATRPLIILPFGTIEWHSYHLPLGLDSLKAQALCEGIAERGDAVLGPLTSWAVGGVPFPYTLRFDLDLIETLMVRIFEQMAVLGFRVVLALTGHYGLEQTLAIKRASLRVMRAYPITVWAAGDFEAVVDLGYRGDHAAKWETSLLWAQRPDLIRLDSIPRSEPLDGILGEDPRGNASADVGASTGQAIVYRWAALGERLLTNTSALQRMQYLEALAAGVRVMDKLLAERSVKPRSQVPSLTTTAYLDHLTALYTGDYLTAQVRAEAKLIDLYA
jgi:creatinine amidohydrolase